MKTIFLLGITVLFPALSGAGDWNQFRGPNGSGVADASCRPPVKPGAGHLAWKVALAPGLSSPVLSADRVFITAVEGERLVTLAFDKASGELAWRREAPAVPLEKVHQTSSPAASTPLVDAERVYVYFGSFGLLCYDHDGNEQWSKAIPTPKSLYGMSTSPIAYGDHLILVLDNDANLSGSRLSQSQIVALRKSDGEQVWIAERPHHRSAWSTPMIWKHDGGDELVVLGNKNARSYDPKTGAEKWFVGGFSRETIAVPVAGGGKVYVASAQLGGIADARIDPAPFWEALLRFDANGDGKLEAAEMTEHFTYPLRPELPIGHVGFGIPLPRDAGERKKRQRGIFGWVDKDKDGFWTQEEWEQHLSSKRGRPLLLAIEPGGQGNIADSHIAWELNRSIPEIPSPLFHDGRIYLVRNGGLLAAINTEDGKQLYRERLGGSGQYSASPVVANGYLYLVSNRGQIAVVKPGDEFEQVHAFDLGEPAFVTPAVDADTIYFRTDKHLWAFRSTPVSTAAAAREESVKPGINKKFLDPDLKVDEWLQRFEVESREVFHARQAVLEACGLEKGSCVADIGAGTGLYTRMFANAVGDGGWVYAVDINPRFLEHIQARAKQEGQGNITSVLCPEDSVTLPPASVDVVFVCDTYHHFEFPRSTMESVVAAMKPGASLVLIDFERIVGKSDPWILGHVRAGKKVFRKEIEDAGLRFVEQLAVEGLEENYFLRFTKPAE